MLLDFYLLISFTVAILSIISHYLEISNNYEVDNAFWYFNLIDMAFPLSILFIYFFVFCVEQVRKSYCLYKIYKKLNEA